MSQKTHPNIIKALNGTIWAMYPPKMVEIAMFITGLGPDGVVNAADSEVFGDYEGPEPFVLDNGVAVVPVRDTIMKRMNMFSRFSGGTSTEQLTTLMGSLATNPDVKGVVLDIDSPGGSVEGLTTLAAAIRDLSKYKPTAALANDMMASAAYFIGSAARRVYTTPDAMVGSIGTITSRYSYARALEEAGIDFEAWRSGPYKALGFMAEPVSDAERSETQKMVDSYYKLFVDAVSTNRNISRETALALADGRIYVGAESVQLNLTDGVKTYEQVIEEVGAEASATDKVFALKAALEAAETEVTATNERIKALEAKIAQFEEAEKIAKAAEEKARIDAAVKQLIETEKKVLPTAEETLRARLAADYDGTMASFALVSVGAAAPAEVVVASDAKEKSSDDLIAEAKAKDIPIAEDEDAAAIFDRFGQSYLRNFGGVVEFVNLTEEAQA